MGEEKGRRHLSAGELKGNMPKPWKNKQLVLLSEVSLSSDIEPFVKWVLFSDADRILAVKPDTERERRE